MSAAETSRDLARARVAELRVRGRLRSPAVRGLLAVLGLVLLVAAVPLVVVLPELGVPALLLGLRLLAVEFDWAASAFAWVTWRWSQLLEWFHGLSTPLRTLVLLALAAVAILLIWLLVEELG